MNLCFLAGGTSSVSSSVGVLFSLSNCEQIKTQTLNIKFLIDENQNEMSVKCFVVSHT